MMPLFHVLIISSDEQVHHIARTQLALLGYTVTSAFTAEEATEYAHTLKPDVLLLDAVQGSTSLPALALLRDFSLNHQPYTLVITKADDTTQRQEYLDRGADDFLCTPLTAEELSIHFRLATRRLSSVQSLQGELRTLHTEFNRLHSLYEQSKAGILRIDILSGCITEANPQAATLLDVPSGLKGYAFADILGDAAAAEHFLHYITEKNTICDYEFGKGIDKATRRWFLLSGYYIPESHSACCLLFDVTTTKNFVADREDLLVRLSRQRHELQEKNVLLTQAHEEIKIQHSRLFEQALRIEESRAELEVSMSQMQHMNTELAEKKVALEMTVQRLRDTQTQLVHSERSNAIGSMTAGIMHEINNPNSACYAAVQDAIQGMHDFRQTLLSMIPQEEHKSVAAGKLQNKIDDVVAVLHIASSASERITHTVNTLRDFSGFQRAEARAVRLCDILTSTTRLFGYKYPHIITTITAEDEETEVYGNVGELNQMFLNIFMNAAQAEAQQIDIHISGQGTMACVCIEDNGKGIVDDIRANIFMPFFSTKGGEHSGIGLSISKNIVERHGGNINVECEYGTRFKILLPCADTIPREVPVL